MADNILDLLVTVTSFVWDIFSSLLDATGFTTIFIGVVVIIMIYRLILVPIFGGRLDFSDRGHTIPISKNNSDASHEIHGYQNSNNNSDHRYTNGS